MDLESVSKKEITSVLIEAIVVGVLLVLFTNLLKPYVSYMPNLSGQPENIELYLITGAVFHIACEYTGLNMWYSKQYCKLF